MASKLVNEKTLHVFLAIFFIAMFFTADGNSAVNQSQACINLGTKHIFYANTMGCMPGV
jgi:hypothetical protein